MSSPSTYTQLVGPRFFLNPTDATMDLSDIIADVYRFEYHEDEKHQDRLHLFVNNSNLKYTDDPRFIEGLQFQVQWGYPTFDLSEPRTAIIVKASPSFPNGGIPTYEIAAFDLRRNMNRLSNPYNWGAVASSDIATTIANRYNFSTDIEPSGDARPQHRIQTASETDLQFLMSLASKLNWDCYLDGSVLHFHSKRYSAAPTLSFTYYTDPVGTLLEFKPHVNLNKPPQVGAAGADTKTQNVNAPTGANSNSLGNYEISTQQNNKFIASVVGVATSGGTILNPSHETAQNVIDAHANANKQRIDMSALKGMARFVGTPQLRARSIIQLNGIGQVYSGNWRVASVSHVIEVRSNIYECHVELSRNGVNQGTSPATNPNTKDPQQANSAVSISTQTGNKFNAKVVNP